MTYLIEFQDGTKETVDLLEIVLSQDEIKSPGLKALKKALLDGGENSG